MSVEGRVELIQTALTYRDRRLDDLDAALLGEAIEHVDPERLEALDEAVFGGARPAAVLVSTPNREHNVRYEWLEAGKLRHRAPRFEWTRKELAGWAGKIAARHGYEAETGEIGPGDDEVGAPTLRGTFRRCRLSIRDYGLVVLVGVSGAGKSTLAARGFAPSEVLASDHYRNVVGDGLRDRTTTHDCFAVMRDIAARRLGRRLLTVVDATNVDNDERREWVRLAERAHAPSTAIVLDMDRETCLRQHAARGDQGRPRQVQRSVSTRLMERVSAGKDQTAAALETVARFAVHPRRLIYVPPTMAPPRRRHCPTCWRIPPRRSRTTRRGASTRWCARRSTWGRARSPSCAGTGQPPGTGSTPTPARPESCTRGPATGSSATAGAASGCSASCAAGARRRACSTRSTADGSASTARSCRGRRRGRG